VERSWKKIIDPFSNPDIDSPLYPTHLYYYFFQPDLSERRAGPSGGGGAQHRPVFLMRPKPCRTLVPASPRVRLRNPIRKWSEAEAKLSDNTTRGRISMPEDAATVLESERRRRFKLEHREKRRETLRPSPRKSRPCRFCLKSLGEMRTGFQNFLFLRLRSQWRCSCGRSLAELSLPHTCKSEGPFA
jgi:hypothetical protein